MTFKGIMKSLMGKRETSIHTEPSAATGELLTSADFPIIPASSVDLNRYHAVPLTELAALGSAFSMLPETARTITQTVTTRVGLGTPVFAGLWPDGVVGKMVDKGMGYSGIIRGNNGRIAGNMRFKQLDGGLPVTTTVNSVAPFDPTTMVVAAALICIDKKLDSLQEKAGEILQFLKLEKQSKQRGNLNMLAEIMEEYRRNCNNEKMCALRVVAVQGIKREAHQDLIFYQEQITGKLQQQKAVHRTQDAQAFLDAVMHEFCEYQLSAYLYAYASFMEVMLQKNFDEAAAVAEKIEACAQKYNALYLNCRAQIAAYHRTAIESQLIGGLGSAARTVGHRIAAVPILNKAPLDEALISAGETMRRHNRDSVTKRLEGFESLQDSRMHTFIDNLRTVNLLCNRPEAMITDGENLYILETA